MKVMNKRIKWLDLLKGISILGVIFCHSQISNGMFNALEYVVLCFVMPVFFAISGYLYKPTTTLTKYKQMVYKKVVGLGGPCLIITLLYFVVHVIKSHNLSFMYEIFSSPISYLWFLYTLFFIFLFVGTMYLFKISLKFQVIIALIFMFIELIFNHNGGYINPITGFLSFIICFYIGFIIRKYHFNHVLGKKKNMYGLLVLWIILISFEIHISFSINPIYNNDMLTYIDVITKLLSIFVLFSLAICMQQVHHKNKIYKFIKYFTNYGRYTLIIYLSQAPILMVLNKVCKLVNISNKYLLLIILLILGWYISVFICYIAKHFELLNFIFYPRKYTDKYFLRKLH